MNSEDIYKWLLANIARLGIMLDADFASMGNLLAPLAQAI